MRTNHWYRRSVEIITAVLRACEAEGLDKKATLKRVSDAYPFGERAMWPYKQWLAARHALCFPEKATGKAAGAQARARKEGRLVFGVHDAQARRRPAL